MSIGKETVLADDDFILSETDIKGNIILVNEDFVRVSEFSQEELIGQPHNFIRHPDMPRAAFKDLWETIQAGKIWTGYVKNRTKSNGYYWVFATVSPFHSCSGEAGYLSCRKKASAEEIARAEKLYSTME